MKSNINITGNIYIRSRENVAEDRPFVNAVQGHTALKLLRDDYLYGLPANMQLNELQTQELTQGASCGFAANGEITHGKGYVDGKLQWVGRCEYADCDKFATCPAAWQIERAVADVAVHIDRPSEFRFLGEDISVDSDEADSEELELVSEFVAEDISETLETLETLETMDPLDLAESEVPTEEVAEADDQNESEVGYAEFYSKFERLHDPEMIIRAPLDSRILVNAGPGTGKTYSVIQRLLYILSNDLIRPDKILILCYSRAAVKVIRTRIADGVRQGELPVEANQLGVFTFDWFATKYLTELEIKLAGASYDERIEMFNDNIRAEYFTREFFEYLIVDELQDLVDARARMVLGLLGVMQCGYLLLGDRCQAIYDFGTKLSSVDFYQDLQEVLPSTTLYYELVQNNRQTGVLATISDEIRTVLLQDTPKMQNICLNKVIKDLPVFARKIEQLSNAEFDQTKRTAILCRNNGEVLRICSLLGDAGTKYRVLRGNMSKAKYKRFVADVFWDFVASEMGVEEFCMRYIARVKADKQEAIRMFEELCLLTDSSGSVINMADLRRALLNYDPTGSLATDDDCNLFVSTIHRAKGQEFDTVYLLRYSAKADEKNADEARVRYVGVTRAKTTLEKISIAVGVFDKVRERPYRKAYRGKYFSSNSYCSGIAVCYDEHIDRTSFVDTHVHDNVWHNQQYIAENVKRLDRVEAIYCEQEGIYNIVHAGVKIGALVPESASRFWEIVCCTSDKRNIPKKLTDLFVHDVYTVVEKAHNESLSTIHKQSRIWLGLDIVGMGRTNYNGYS